MNSGSWFQRINLNKKLAIMMAIPITALLWSSHGQIRYLLDLQSESDSVMFLVELAAKTSEMVHEIQKERGLSAAYIGSKGTRLGTELQSQQKLTNKKRDQLLDFLETFPIDKFGTDFGVKLNTGLSLLKKLNSYRQRTIELDIPLKEAIDYYTDVNGTFLEVAGFLPKLSKDSEVSNAAVAYVNFLLGKERAGIERAVLANTFAADEFANGMLRRFIELENEQETYFNAFLAMATPDQKTQFNTLLKDQSIADVESMRNTAYTVNEKRSAASHIASSLGYGGLIHNFKNFVLSGKTMYADAFHRDSERVNAALREFAALPGISESDQKDINTIKQLLEEYSTALSRAKEMWNSNHSIKSIERTTRVADGPALIAVTNLTKGGFGIDSGDWFATATKRINLLKKNEDQLSNDFSSIANILSSRASSEFTLVLIITALAIGATGILSWYLSNLITAPVEEAVRVSRHISDGDLSDQIETAATDETGQLLIAMKSMQERLLSVIREDIQSVVDAACEGDLSIRIPLEGKTGFYKELGQSINELIDINDRVITDTGKALGAMASGDLTVAISADYRGSFDRLKTDVTHMQNTLSDIIDNEIQAIINAAGQGDLSQRISLTGKKGFYKSLSSSINNLVDVSERVTTDVNILVGAMAEGDLTKSINTEYQGSFGVLQNNIATLQNRLSEVIEKDIQSIVEAAVAGDLEQRIELDGKTGFYNTLSSSINNLVDVNNRIISDTTRVIGAIADGDLTKFITNDYKGSFNLLKDDVNKTVVKLTGVVAEISDSSTLVKSGATEIAMGNTSLSQRTESQAASLEETTAAMEEITSAIQQNADNAKVADGLAQNASDSANIGRQVVSEAVTAMESINESSKKISDIISVIDEIAFQTNLLALNASVEAARAGEQGRGFAVVADEVRNLAGRSAIAAKEIKTLIVDSRSRVEGGSRLVNKSGESLDEITTSVKKVSDVIAEISFASEEQASGINEVNKAIMQMDEITQQNAALVEEAAAAAESLGEQSVVLDEQISFFSVTNGTDNPDYPPTAHSKSVSDTASPALALVDQAETPRLQGESNDEWGIVLTH